MIIKKERNTIQIPLDKSMEFILYEPSHCKKQEKRTKLPPDGKRDTKYSKDKNTHHICICTDFDHCP